MKIKLLLAALCLLTTACADKAPDKKPRPMTAAQQHPFLNRVVGSGQASPFSASENGSGKRRGKRSSLAMGGRSGSSRREIANRASSSIPTETFTASRRPANRDGAKTAGLDGSLSGIVAGGAAVTAPDTQPKPLVLSTPSD